MNDVLRYSPTSTSRPIHSILLVEDNQDDIFLIKRAFKKLNLPFTANFVQDGQSAIEYFSQNDRTEYPLPRWIITDIKMPGIGGLELVRWMKTSAFQSTPIIILSSSGQRTDILEAYKAGVCGYFVKPSQFDEMLEIWRVLATYWGKAMHP
jgi:CheY-like chemotaxis protein